MSDNTDVTVSNPKPSRDISIEEKIQKFLSTILVTKHHDIDLKDGSTSSSVIVDTDNELLRSSCSTKSDSYNPSLANYPVLSKLLFKEGSVWLNRDVLKRAVDCVPSLHGWTAIFKKQTIQCNRYGKKSSI